MINEITYLKLKRTLLKNFRQANVFIEENFINKIKFYDISRIELIGLDAQYIFEF